MEGLDGVLGWGRGGGGRRRITHLRIPHPNTHVNIVKNKRGRRTEDVVRDAVEAHAVLVRRVEPLPRPLQLCVSTCDVVRLV